MCRNVCQPKWPTIPISLAGVENTSTEAYRTITDLQNSEGDLQVVDKAWRPRRDLNPCYRRERARIYWITL